MSEVLPVVYVARHGNTAWTHSGQHTGLTDLPLTPDGERNARQLGERLKGMTFAKVFTSTLQRARRLTSCGVWFAAHPGRARTAVGIYRDQGHLERSFGSMNSPPIRRGDLANASPPGVPCQASQFCR
jgi:broad specificity phosphatase PhoE